ncbi:MAG: component of SufBCD complex [Pseudomonadota bacterium]
MDLFDTIFELIDMRSFSNLWFWIMLAVLWSSVSHWVIGVPWDMVVRARRRDEEQTVEDLHHLVRVNCNRILLISDEVGLILCGVICFSLTTLVLLGFFYDNEFSQAVFLLALPMTFLALLSVRSARVIRRDNLTGEALYRRLSRHRIVTQAIGLVSIFVTAVWGMLQNYTNGVLGG